MSLVHVWRKAWRPEHVAIVCPDGTPITYRELELRIGRARRWLHDHGVGHGSIVAVQWPKDLRFLEIHLALLSMGAATLPMNPQYTPAEVRFLVDDADADWVLLDQGAEDPGRRHLTLEAVDYDHLEPLPLAAPVDPSTLAVLCYTSGTTGKPKGARISQRALRLDGGRLALALLRRLNATRLILVDDVRHSVKEPLERNPLE